MYFPEKYENGNDKKLSGSYTLYTAFLGILKLIAPILPHITEAIFQDFYKPSEEQQSIHQALYTSGNPLSSSPLIQSGGKLFFEIIDLMRKEKSKKGLRLGESIECIEVCATDSDISHLQVFSDDIRSVSKAAKVVFLKAEKLGVSINETFTEKNSRL